MKYNLTDGMLKLHFEADLIHGCTPLEQCVYFHLLSDKEKLYDYFDTYMV